LPQQKLNRLTDKILLKFQLAAANFRSLASKMKGKVLRQRTCLNLIAAVILVGGLVTAALIYRNAKNIPHDAWGYEVVDGVIYPIMPQDSKMYRHNLEVYGGKLNVMIDDFNRWFAGLWRGKSLALITGGASIIISFGLFYKAQYSSPARKSAADPQPDLDGTK